MRKDMKYDKEKFKSLMHYIIYKYRCKENVGKTILYKLLYFTDFNYYELYEKLLTGECYIKGVKGPSPRDFDDAKDELVLECKIKELKKEYLGYTQIKYSSLETPDINIFSKEELDCINNTVEHLQNKNGSEMSAYSHGDMPWLAAYVNEELEPEYVFYRNPQYCVRKYDEIQI